MLKNVDRNCFCNNKRIVAMSISREQFKEKFGARLYNGILGNLTGEKKRFISSVQSISPVWPFATPWTAAHQASLSITNSRSLLKLMSIESAMPSNHLILCRPLLLPPSIFPSIRVFSNESALHIRWPKSTWWKCFPFTHSIFLVLLLQINWLLM